VDLEPDAPFFQHTRRREGLDGKLHPPVKFLNLLICFQSLFYISHDSAVADFDKRCVLWLSIHSHNEYLIPFLYRDKMGG